MRNLLFTAWHISCTLKLVKSLSEIKINLMESFWKKTLFSVKIALIGLIPMLYCVNQDGVYYVFIHSQFVFAMLVRSLYHVWLNIFRFSEIAASYYVNRLFLKVFSFFCFCNKKPFFGGQQPCWEGGRIVLAKNVKNPYFDPWIWNKVSPWREWNCLRQIEQFEINSSN